MDQILDLAIGETRNQLYWKNTRITWKDFAEKLAHTHYDVETQDQFFKMSREDQDAKKDVGAYVGGYCSGGLRGAHNILHRQILTLDLDNNPHRIWEKFLLTYDCAGVVHSTRKHTPQAQRLRLLIPMSRPVVPDEYIAISRRVAGNIGIDMFDPTTFQPNRYMFWPSTSKGAEYVYKLNTGPWLDADQVLGTYVDWQDSSAWPSSGKFNDEIKRNKDKQGDPKTKPGFIGGFNRTYGIAETIDLFLKNVYYPGTVANRYTYAHGSTSNGLIVYNDEFAYSHHGTDPAGGKLSNAFDLVRIHLFGLKDEDAKPDTPITSLPSYKEMREYAKILPDVTQTMVKERKEKTAHNFQTTYVDPVVSANPEYLSADPTEIEPDEPDEPRDVVDPQLLTPPAGEDWEKYLDRDNNGGTLPNVNNFVLILENDPKFRGLFAYDDFEKFPIATRNLPWRPINLVDDSRLLQDIDDHNITHYIQTTYGAYSIKMLESALAIVCYRNTFHPIKDYLAGLVWDGVARVDRLLVDYMGADDNEYTRTVTRKTLCAAVGRIRTPGIKFEYMLTLFGPQGTKKSTLFDKLGGRWFSDSLHTMKGKEAFESLQGAWIIELAEMSAANKSDVENTKAFVAKRKDRFRVAFGRRNSTFPRQCIFVGSTNLQDFLKDKTGGRRFWVVPVHRTRVSKDVFKHLTKKEVDQVWAEAIKFYENGETLYLTPEIEAQAKVIQKEHTESDDRDGLIQNFLETLLPVNWDSLYPAKRAQWLRDEQTNQTGTVKRLQVCAQEIWIECFNETDHKMTPQNTRFIHDCMRQLENWGDGGKRRISPYGIVRTYIRVQSNVAIDVAIKTFLR